MGNDMKRHFMTLIVVLVLALPIYGCWAVGNTKPVPTKIDVPMLTPDEVRALVNNYLDDRASLVSPINLRQNLLAAIAIARPYSTATYQGNGKWQVSGLGYGQKDEDWVFKYGGLWNLYEISGTIEPANSEASALLLYIQHWTK
jgi:hypothetical protein